MTDLIHAMKIYAIFIKISYNVTNSYRELKQIDRKIVSSYIGANGTRKKNQSDSDLTLT